MGRHPAVAHPQPTLQAGQLYLRELRGLEELHGPEHEETQASRRNLQLFQVRRWEKPTNCFQDAHWPHGFHCKLFFF
ncbi:unnamed protein product [Cladocopium goreaui]|uniref:Uncharacterized protein n=1 Tax=Cladocopium goreaui TaxID=2562237 RepID=A0A9P1FNY2_9DINO|nr:unnamed protein product [Cladocopium goreaui]